MRKVPSLQCSLLHVMPHTLTCAEVVSAAPEMQDFVSELLFFKYEMSLLKISVRNNISLFKALFSCSKTPCLGKSSATAQA